MKVYGFKKLQQHLKKNILMSTKLLKKICPGSLSKSAPGSTMMRNALFSIGKET